MLSLPYFAADEAQTLDAIFRNDEGAINGLTSYHTQGLAFLISICTSAATAEFAKTKKGLLAYKYSNSYSFFLVFLSLIVVSAALTWGSNGAPSHLNWPSWVLNSTRFGILTLLARLTSPSCGLGLSLCASLGWSAKAVYATNEHDAGSMATRVWDRHVNTSQLLPSL
jgi:hypothetical protein